MNLLLAQLVLALSFGGTVRAAAHGIVDRFQGRSVAVLDPSDEPDDQGSYGDPDEDQDSDDSSDEEDVDLEVTPFAAPTPPTPPIPPTPPVPPRAPLPPTPPAAFPDEPGDFSTFSETGKSVPTVDVLHRIARVGGWSLTIVGSPNPRIDFDLQNVEPREALRQVLRESGAMGVLRRGRLVVVAAPDKSTGGMLVESRSRKGRKASSGRASVNDVVKVFQGDLVVPQGTVVQGDVVNVGGSIDVEPGSVVQGDAVSIFGSTTVEQGGVVLGDTAAVFGTVDVERGGQVMGEHINIGLGKIFGGSHRANPRSMLSHLGPFGLFPSLALFAVIYLLGLLGLRVWPERIRSVGHAMFEQPVRSFVVGFLCWLLLLPVVILLCISIVGIPLVPLLPVAMFLAVVMGFSALALRMGEAMPAGPGERFVPPAALGMGTIALLLVAFVPLLGLPVFFLVSLFALGAAVSSRFGRALPPHV